MRERTPTRAVVRKCAAALSDARSPLRMCPRAYPGVRGCARRLLFYASANERKRTRTRAIVREASLGAVLARFGTNVAPGVASLTLRARLGLLSGPPGRGVRLFWMILVLEMKAS